jgi:hypothetical protein
MAIASSPVAVLVNRGEIVRATMVPSRRVLDEAIDEVAAKCTRGRSCWYGPFLCSFYRSYA